MKTATRPRCLKSHPTIRPSMRLCGTTISCLILFSFIPALRAQTAGGAIQGRVLNVTSGAYLNNARVTLEGTNIETFTDAGGEYRLIGVPPGDYKLAAFFTGLDQQQTAVSIRPGSVLNHDFTLDRRTGDGKEGPVALDPFVVATNREFNAQAIAINEQRFAPNIKNVVSAEEFGDIGESNIGEFIKFMPGVAVNYSVGIMAASVSVRGFPASTTPLTIDGVAPASAGSANINRTFDINEFQALNNIARIEVMKVPTPDSPASSLGGAINITSKSAFERAKPEYSYRLYATTNSRTLSDTKRPSPGREETAYVTQPAVDVGLVVPVNKRFGFTVSASHNPRFVMTENSQGTWALVGTPVLRTYEVATAPQLRVASSLGTTVDWKLAEKHVFGATIQYGETSQLSDSYRFAPNVGNSSTGGPTFSESLNFGGSVQMLNRSQNRHSKTWQTSWKYRFVGHAFKVDANAYYSYSTSKGRDTDKGEFDRADIRLNNVAVRMDEINNPRHPGPNVITARTATGSVDPHDANNFTLQTVGSAPRNAAADKFGAQVNVARPLALPVPLELKGGLHFTRELRDNRAPVYSWTFLGPDGIAANADNRVGLYDFIARENSSVTPPYGIRRITWHSPYKIFDLYRQHPEYFRLDEAAAIIGAASGSSQIAETISAGYVRADLKLLQNRLWIVGGVRGERTDDNGAGLLNDIRTTRRQDSQGRLILDSAGRPVPITTDPVAVARLQYTERGAHARRDYTDYYPSLNVSYNITDRVIARFGYAHTIGRPDFGNIVPGVAITAPESATPTITVNNTGLKPWRAVAYDLSLEAYIGRNGLASVGAFRKNVSDFFGRVTRAATAEFLADNGLNEAYLGYEVVTRDNVGDAQISGFEFNYRQNLTFLPNWGRGFHVFANGTLLDLEGPNTADFGQFSERLFNWGAGLTRSRFSVKLNWAHTGEVNMGLFAASATIPPGTYTYTLARTTLDASFEWRLHKRIALYGTARNLTNAPVRGQRYAPDTPAYARNIQYLEPGAFITIGLKGAF